MRSVRVLAGIVWALALGTGCGDGGDTSPPDNTAPVANFTVPACVLDVPCGFVSTSTDDVQVTGWSWDFDGDGTPDASTASASYTYTEPGEFSVSLTVRDAEGLSDTRTGQITIAPAAGGAPVALFEVPACVLDVPCEFVSTSIDDAGVTEWSWDFDGDNTPDATTGTASFTYTTPGTYEVSLTVRDADGLTDTKTSPITIAPPGNAPPTASFALPACTINVPCEFASTSTDDVQVTGWSWDFDGDGTEDAATATAQFTYVAAGTFTVSLTVTDAGGLTDTESATITIAPAPNTPPTAEFTHVCNAGECAFTSTSTDAAPGSIVSWAWTFGDGATASVSAPTHTYAITATTDFTVTLTVTDNDGATDTESRVITVSPPAGGAEGCTTVGTRVDCVLDIDSRSTVRLTLLGISCDLGGQRITVPPPIGDQVFLNVCTRTVGESLRIFGGPLDEAIVFEAGSQVRIRFNQGNAGAGDPPLAAPVGQLSGAFPNWTINFEDGDNAGAAGEPDFTDVVLGVEALPEP